MITTDGIAYGKSRSDCSDSQLQILLRLVEETRNVHGAIVEIGSWKCGSSIMMASANRHKDVYAFDLFGGLPYGVGAGFENFGQTDWDEILSATEPYGVILVRGKHEDTIPKVASTLGPLSLIFMDSDHYSSHKVALENLTPQLSPGGVILFHDWTFPAVEQTVRETLDLSQFEMLCGTDMLHMGALKKK